MILQNLCKICKNLLKIHNISLRSQLSLYKILVLSFPPSYFVCNLNALNTHIQLPNTLSFTLFSLDLYIYKQKEIKPHT
ncbi:hypothetical protein HanXRQr2_Chr14g0641551 [Helianthus annuus]|uniref:Uncharacterized protein n=1 Tax=Helianthus annuus TaxID=4232 RepID=A0A9K3H6B4_HELAN|nr:hypothetical protein HanXRQr2_Chr14g0641551 [Helianthus annuus]KAJ0464019.1 hypothetical protein HanHA300_Chr14g0522281 [Helianthus annuus]KAJ0659778.1 hypothetical protein HanOQP8_Chr14g0530061 [Helianthus annuus]